MHKEKDDHPYLLVYNWLSRRSSGYGTVRVSKQVSKQGDLQTQYPQCVCESVKNVPTPSHLEQEKSASSMLALPLTSLQLQLPRYLLASCQRRPARLNLLLLLPEQLLHLDEQLVPLGGKLLETKKRKLLRKQTRLDEQIGMQATTCQNGGNVVTRRWRERDGGSRRAARAPTPVSERTIAHPAKR